MNIDLNLFVGEDEIVSSSVYTILSKDQIFICKKQVCVIGKQEETKIFEEVWISLIAELRARGAP